MIDGLLERLRMNTLHLEWARVHTQPSRLEFTLRAVLAARAACSGGQ